MPTFFYLATAELADREPAIRKLFIVRPGPLLQEDNRSQDAILDSVIAKGGEYTYHATYTLPPYIAEPIVDCIKQRMVKEFRPKCNWDVHIDIVNRIRMP
jgi:hypothetical protein